MRIQNGILVTIENGRFENGYVDFENGVITAFGDLSCTVTVKAREVEMSAETLSATAGDAAQKLTVTITPADADAEITWESSDTAVATVDEDGTVTFVAEGDATITAKTPYGDVTCTVTVAAKFPNSSVTSTR